LIDAGRRASSPCSTRLDLALAVVLELVEAVLGSVADDLA
jgi:hypothetical protein